MWSVWSKPVQLYLGQGLVLLQVAGKETLTQHAPVTMPLERILGSLNGLVLRGSQVRVTLSGAWCPAIELALPEGTKGWREQRDLTHAWAAESQGLKADDVACEMDFRRSGLVATVATSVTTELNRWAEQQGVHIGSIRPLWSEATQWRVSKQTSILGLQVQEPDSVTLLADGQGNGRVRAITVQGSHTEIAVQARVRSLLISSGLAQDRIQIIGFDANPKTILSNGPRLWAEHWYRP